MKANEINMRMIAILAFFTLGLFVSCNEDDTQNIISQLETNEKESLLFMLEEEKMARDVYQYLFDLWNLNQFNNIKQSEQSHINAVITLLEKYTVAYQVLPEGQFNNSQLQQLYNSLIETGENSLVDALKVGATIEDLDIFDLEQQMSQIENTNILNVFSSLQCGSRNHLRAFVRSLNMQDASYTPQYITLSEYEQIINSSNEQCN